MLGISMPRGSQSPGNITKPADPSKADFNFDGWYTDTALTTPFDFSQKVSESMTLYAKWSEVIKDEYIGPEDMAINYTETETDTDRTVNVTASTVDGVSIRSISIYQDEVRVARSVLSNTLTATIDKNGDYEVIVVDTRYESGQTNVYDLTEEVEPEPEAPLDSTVSVTNNTIDLTLSEMVRLIDFSKDNWIVKRKVFTDTFNYTPKEGGTYKLKIMELDRTTTYETVIIDEQTGPVYDNPTQIVDASFIQNGEGYDISVNVTPSDLARTRTIEVFKDGKRLDRAIFKDTLSTTVTETGDYLIKVMNMKYEVVETTLSVQ